MIIIEDGGRQGNRVLNRGICINKNNNSRYHRNEFEMSQWVTAKPVLPPVDISMLKNGVSVSLFFLVGLGLSFLVHDGIFPKTVSCST